MEKSVNSFQKLDGQSNFLNYTKKSVQYNYFLQIKKYQKLLLSNILKKEKNIENKQNNIFTNNIIYQINQNKLKDLNQNTSNTNMLQSQIIHTVQLSNPQINSNNNNIFEDEEAFTKPIENHLDTLKEQLNAILMDDFVTGGNLNKKITYLELLKTQYKDLFNIGAQLTNELKFILINDEKNDTFDYKTTQDVSFNVDSQKVTIKKGTSLVEINEKFDLGKSIKKGGYGIQGLRFTLIDGILYAFIHLPDFGENNSIIHDNIKNYLDDCQQYKTNNCIASKKEFNEILTRNELCLLFIKAFAGISRGYTFNEDGTYKDDGVYTHFVILSSQTANNNIEQNY
jgi:hypothetical protein